jgi:hypothetical protein
MKVANEAKELLESIYGIDYFRDVLTKGQIQVIENLRTLISRFGDAAYITKNQFKILEESLELLVIT